MYQRFLNNNDYIGIITEEALSQLIRGNEERLSQAEEAAEESIIEYLVDNYMVEETLAQGKNIMPYNRHIIYPVGAHFYHEGKIYEAIRSIASSKSPSLLVYWKEYDEYIENEQEIADYSQLQDYHPGTIVRFANIYYICIEPNGLSFNDIRVPGVQAWESVETYEWQANLEYNLWEVVLYDGIYYTLLTQENIDWSANPLISDNWGRIGDYDPELNDYEYSEHEYVVFDDMVLHPVMPVNSDALVDGYNIRQHDPRNSNIKKHMLRLALYELHKLISPNNVSSARITDYETSIAWLRDASKLRINPKIPRRIDDERKPVAEYAIATFMRDYDPYQNPWQI